jgi:predicted Rossmann fold flavoprotein
MLYYLKHSIGGTPVQSTKILIVGGGAAGLAAAVTAAVCGGSVTLLERAERVGKKILKTGNGRCNLSNTRVVPEGYNTPNFVRPVLSHIGCAELREFFAQLGLLTYSDLEGRVYPVSNTAASVLDVLRLSAEELGVVTVCGFDAARLIPRGVISADGQKISSDAVIVAAGGGAALLETVGHSVTPFSPVLCPLATDAAPIRGMSGVRLQCMATLVRGGHALLTLPGEVLFRDYGLSGIVIFDFSRFARMGDEISLDLMPEYERGEIAKLLQNRKTRHSSREGKDLLTGIFHSRVSAALLRAAGDDCDKLAATIKDFRISVRGAAEPAQAQVTRGGAKLAEFSPDTLRSAYHDWLYAAGEVLDVDGQCGGFNLHWAFASGITAARAAAGVVI